MPEKSKLNWDIEFPFESRQRRETFARFGLATYHAQCIERQLGILLATTLNRDFLRFTYEERDKYFEKEFAKTLGQMLKTLQTKTKVSATLESRLLKALDIRNWLAHRYFWERAGSIVTSSGRECMLIELQDAADYLQEIDEELVSISERWCERVGISKEIIQEELQKLIKDENA